MGVSFHVVPVGLIGARAVVITFLLLTVRHCQMQYTNHIVTGNETYVNDV